MKKVKKVKIIFEPEADVLSWETGNGVIDHAEEIANMVVHFSKKYARTGEILEASQFLSKARGLVGKRSKQVVLV